MVSVRRRFAESHKKHATSSEQTLSTKDGADRGLAGLKSSGPQYISKWMKRNHNSIMASYTFNFVALALVLAVGLYSARFLFELHDDVVVSHAEVVTRHFIEVPCSKDYDQRFKVCTPKTCGRCIMDNKFSEEEIKSLQTIAKKAMKHGGSSGGATILDLNSGALSKGKQFINVYKIKEKIFDEIDFHVYKQVKDKIHTIVANEFQIPRNSVHLTKPTFFSRLDPTPAKTVHDEYWHAHVDKVTYGSFDYTSLLYLSEYETEFQGGRFFFVDKWNNKSVEPRPGRLSFFTSGSENEHFVERVTQGVRFALTVSFTCDKRAAIGDPINH